MIETAHRHNLDTKRVGDGQGGGSVDILVRYACTEPHCFVIFLVSDVSVVRGQTVFRSTFDQLYS